MSALRAPVAAEAGLGGILEAKVILPTDPMPGWYPAEFRRDWEDLLAASDNVNAMYQSPDWFEHMGRLMRPDDRLALVSVRDDLGRLAGVVPLRIARYGLHFHISGHSLGSVPIRKVFLLGGHPLLPPDEALHDRVFGYIHSAFPDCPGVGLAGVPRDSFAWDYLNRSELIARRFLVYPIDGLQVYHTLELPPTFDALLARFSSKKRYNLKRQVRLLREHEGAGLELRAVEAPDRVPAYLEAVAALAPRKWRSGHLVTAVTPGERQIAIQVDQAEHGLLLGYVLYHGGRPVASIMGQIFGADFLVDGTHFDKALEAFSPGTVLLYLALQDLIERRGVRLINFGFGEPAYRLSNTVSEYASVLLLRKTARNRLIRAAHRAFRSSLGHLKRFRRGPDVGPGRAEPPGEGGSAPHPRQSGNPPAE